MSISNYPESNDVFVNPGPTSKVNEIDHAGQHQKANAAILAIQQFIGNSSSDGATIIGMIQALQFQINNLQSQLDEFQSAPYVPQYSVGTLPPGNSVPTGSLALVTDEVDGEVLAFTDGASWRRVTDRAIVS